MESFKFRCDIAVTAGARWSDGVSTDDWCDSAVEWWKHPAMHCAFPRAVPPTNMAKLGPLPGALTEALVEPPAPRGVVDIPI